jgi:thiol-disulfide isomerase/thioredoxin
MKSAFGRFTLAAVLGSSALFASLASGQAKPFPDEWFFEGTARPAQLKSLEGKPAADITAASWIGAETTIQASRGKVIVLDFWATWCGPCMAAIPENIKLVNEYKDKGMVFIGVHDGNSGTEEAPGVVQKKGINYPIAIDKAAKPLSTTAAAYNVQFWPTYVVIDRSGNVRAAGLTPNHVEDVVKALLAESGPASSGSAATAEFAADLYVGGANRPALLKELEGKPLPALKASQWLGTAPGESDLKGAVTIVHFTSPATFCVRELDLVVAAAGEFATTPNVVFAAVCDAGASWDKMKDAATKHKVKFALAHDQAAEKAADAPAAASEKPATDKPAAKAARVRGVTAQACGVSYFPATIVVDRKGVVRAAGIKADKLKPVIEKLLAESVDAPRTGG